MRIQRLLAARDVIMVLCGVDAGTGAGAGVSAIGRALMNVGLLGEESSSSTRRGVEVFGGFSDAMECESFWIPRRFVRSDNGFVRTCV